MSTTASTPLTDRIVDIRARAPENVARVLAERPAGPSPRAMAGS